MNKNNRKLANSRIEEKAKLDEERMKDLQKQVIEAGKKGDKNNVGNALAVAAPLLSLAGALAFRKN